MTYEKRRALDELILVTRGKYEPRPTRDDICSLEGLMPFRGKAIKYTMDGGNTWRFAELYSDPCRFSNGSYGYPMDEEVMPHVGVHCRNSITREQFKKGLVARPATEAEAAKIVFSYH